MLHDRLRVADDGSLAAIGEFAQACRSRVQRLDRLNVL
jgi:hypothetical protein